MSPCLFHVVTLLMRTYGTYDHIWYILVGTLGRRLLATSGKIAARDCPQMAVMLISDKPK